MLFLLKNTARIGSLVACVALVSSPAMAQNAERPDLQGVWTNASLTSLNRRDGVGTLVVSPEEARILAANVPVAGLEGGLDEGDGVNETPEEGKEDFGTRAYNEFWVDPGANLAMIKGEYRTSYVVNPENGRVPRLQNPNYDFERRNFGSRYATGFGDARGPEAIPNAERCLIGFGNKAGPGMMSALYNNTYQFVQTEDHVMILVEMVHDARIIPIFDSPEEARANRRPVELEQWFGDSVGWYEDGELVVESVNINPIQLSQSSIPITKEGRVIERFSRYSDDEIFYQFTVEDSNIYSQPWTAELSFYATEDRLYEYACHEGNYAMPGILAGARRLEMEEAARNQ
ncbi:MAG: hypothetical protein HOF74_15150 [Gammaproteobacteria bacterium]|jgi:hypothetical protein|nr:hypothetical protein [Gammaproteobacteria bacterium]MBT3861166.1 hypothetical protein [Gammaproteobacteria bacterium]MBT3986636.1 hypothetical protein [Gammaproteobacteria bacterium]MBT4255871.1 hypothetical protein [Gammaproteobacteria bacterium]MBT4580995.1 hypothetical protein [Gammaproteobacteria bacterium]